jgi:hypothetical protein
LTDFFDQYVNFVYDPTKSATDEFYRLCDLYGWKKDDQSKLDAKKAFQDALTLQFNDSYGTNVDDLTNWQALCAKLGMDPVPEDLHACQAVRTTFKPRPANEPRILGCPKHACQSCRLGGHLWD